MTTSQPVTGEGRLRRRVLAALVALGLAAAFALTYVVMVRTARGQAVDVRVFRLVFGLVPDGWPVELVTAFARAAAVGALALVATVLGVAAVGRRAWAALTAAVLTLATAVALGPYLRDEVLSRPRFTDETFPLNSLPSTHATAAAALTVAVVLLWPRPRPWWLLNACRGRPPARRRRQRREPGAPTERRRRRRSSWWAPSPAGALALVGTPELATLESLRADRHLDPCAGVGVLPAAVLPDPRERRVVGSGVHRVDQRRRAPVGCSPATGSPPCRPSSASTTCGSPRPARRRPSSRRSYGVEAFVYWHYWFGDGDRILDRPFREVLASGEPEHLVLPRVGQPDVDRHLARRAGPRPQAAALPRARRRPAPLRRAAPGVHRRALPHASTDGRCSTSSVPRSCPNAAAFVERWQRDGAARPACRASTSSRR